MGGWGVDVGKGRLIQSLWRPPLNTGTPAVRPGQLSASLASAPGRRVGVAGGGAAYNPTVWPAGCRAVHAPRPASSPRALSHSPPRSRSVRACRPPHCRGAGPPYPPAPPRKRQHVSAVYFPDPFSPGAGVVHASRALTCRILRHRRRWNISSSGASAGPAGDGAAFAHAEPPTSTPPSPGRLEPPA